MGRLRREGYCGKNKEKGTVREKLKDKSDVAGKE